MSPRDLLSLSRQAPDDKVSLALARYLETLLLFTEAHFFTSHTPSLIIDTLDQLVDHLSAPFDESETHRLLSHPAIRASQTDMWRTLAKVERAISRSLAAKSDPRHASALPDYDRLTAHIGAEADLIHPPLETYRAAPHLSLGLLGMGALPLSALIYWRTHGLPVTCYEAAAEDATLARAYLRRAGIGDDAIRVVHGPYNAYEYTNHPVLIVGPHVPNKKGLLQRLMKRDPGRQVGLRSAVGVFSLLYEPLETQLSGSLYVHFDRRTVSPAGCPWTTYFTAAPSEMLDFEKEEPKPELEDVRYFPPHHHHNHG